MYYFVSFIFEYFPDQDDSYSITEKKRKSTVTQELALRHHSRSLE